MKFILSLLCFSAIAILTGCNSLISSKVVIDYKEAKRKLPIYEIVIKSMPNGDIKYVALGDNREAFKPKICGPYIFPATWYIMISIQNDKSLFTLIDNGGGSIADKEPSYFVYTILSPVLEYNKSSGKIKGYGLAAIEKIQWCKDKKEFRLLDKQGTLDVSFELTPNTDYEKIQFPENVNKLLEHIEHSKKFTSEFVITPKNNIEQNSK